MLSDDRIYIGGAFSQVQGVVRFGVARLNADGSLDITFVPPTNGLVIIGAGSIGFYGLGPISPASGLYIFGRFTQPTGTALRLRPDGSIDPAFHLSTNDEIEGGILQPDDKLVFSHGGSLERVNVDGSTDASWKKSQLFTVQLSMLPDGKLLAGSRRLFTGVGAVGLAPEVHFTLTAGTLQLTWPAGFQLQRTSQLAPAHWQDQPNPSPFTVPLSGPGEFYRVVPAP